MFESRGRENEKPRPVRRLAGDFAWNGARTAGSERRSVRVPVAKTNCGEVLAARAGTRRAAAAAQVQRKEKVWVAVGKKVGSGNGGSDAEDPAAAGGGYAGGDEAEGSVEADEKPEPEDDTDELDGDGLLPGEEMGNYLLGAGDHDRHPGDDGGEETTENLVSESNGLLRLRVKMRRGWIECRHDIDSFAPDLLSLYESLKPSEEHKSKQTQLIDSLAKSLSKEWPNARLHLYGSCANSFGTSHSDVDVCLEIEIGTESTVEILQRLADILHGDNFDDVEVNFHYLEFCNCCDVVTTCSKKEKDWTTRVGNDRHLMCIEDPFEISHDLGRVVDRQTIRIIIEEFERAADVLQHDNDPCVTLFKPYNYGTC